MLLGIPEASPNANRANRMTSPYTAEPPHCDVCHKPIGATQIHHRHKITAARLCLDCVNAFTEPRLGKDFERRKGTA